jgi:hypothetical protein
VSQGRYVVRVGEYDRHVRSYSDRHASQYADKSLRTSAASWAGEASHPGPKRPRRPPTAGRRVANTATATASLRKASSRRARRCSRCPSSRSAHRPRSGNVTRGVRVVIAALRVAGPAT